MTLISSCVQSVALTDAQRLALALAAHPGLHSVSGGYAARGRAGRVQRQTIDALIARGLAVVAEGGGINPTDAGWSVLAATGSR